ncbi:hypothetical protein FPQ18DRAFT_279290 [Pyronema domesticum]|nr:hypothetical protein FPQ18DRAFT_279290 [Pyronema domesticum]
MALISTSFIHCHPSWDALGLCPAQSSQFPFHLFGSMCWCPKTTPKYSSFSPEKEQDYDYDYDYIVVGSGAGGLVLADRLSETGARTLLLERGPESTWKSGGRSGPSWANPLNLTRHDLPSASNSIWVSSPISRCDDYSELAACLLGGGTAINAGLFLAPPDGDWIGWPKGWGMEDMGNARERVLGRVPGWKTDTFGEGWEVLKEVMGREGWKEVDANGERNRKDRAVSRGIFMFTNGTRHGPLGSYFLSSLTRHNFHLQLNTPALRLLRSVGYSRSRINGVVTPRGTITAKKVILASGTFGTAKILLQSGIGPLPQLQTILSSSNGRYLPPKDDWILLPVGKNLMDHYNLDMTISHPKFRGYDFQAAYSDPPLQDLKLYLANRTGPLAESVPAPNVIMWLETTVGNHTMNGQFTTRISSHPNDTSLGISFFLGRGSTSRGEVEITQDGRMVVTKYPWAVTEEDKEATEKMMEEFLGVMERAKGLGVETVKPAKGQDFRSFVGEEREGRGSNHWMGTARIGEDDGRKYKGEEGDVVDPRGRVWGTENLFVADASLFPVQTTGNPTAAIIVVAERIAELVLGAEIRTHAT